MHRAFESGIAMRQALLNDDKQAFNIAIIDNEIDSKNPPKIWQQTLTQDSDTVTIKILKIFTKHTSMNYNLLYPKRRAFA